MSLWSHVRTIDHIDVSDSLNEMIRLWVKDSDEVITMSYKQAEQLLSVVMAILIENNGR